MSEGEESRLVDEMEFEYTVSFPGLGQSGRWGEGLLGSEKEPVLFLFGWAGCQDRYLLKYAQLYQNLGCITVRYIIPVPTLFWNRQQLAVIGGKVYDLFEDLELKGHPVIFHVFSGAGCSVYNSFNRALRGKPDEREIRSHIRGVIFDSTPALTSNWQRSQAYMESSFPNLRPGTWQRALVHWLSYVGFNLFDVVNKIWQWCGGSAYQHYYYQLLDDPDLPQNQLYLYSKADAICSSDSIENFIGSQIMRGASAEAQCWPDSPHCQHYRHYPDEYTKLVAEYLNKIAR